MMMMQKVATSPGGATSHSEAEYLLNVIERPSQLSPAQYQQTTTDTQPHRRVPSVASPERDVNQQLVERIEELYRQLHQTTPTAPTAV